MELKETDSSSLYNNQFISSSAVYNVYMAVTIVFFFYVTSLYFHFIPLNSTPLYSRTPYNQHSQLQSTIYIYTYVYIPINLITCSGHVEKDQVRSSSLDGVGVFRL